MATLNNLSLSITLDGSPLEKKGIKVSSVSISIPVNGIALADIDAKIMTNGTFASSYAGVESSAGMKALEESHGKPIEISVGKPGPLGYYSGAKLFSGIVTGIGERSAISADGISITISIHCSSKLITLQNIPIFAFGFHSANSMNVTVTASSFNNNLAADDWIKKLAPIKDGVSIFKKFIELFLNTYKDIDKFVVKDAGQKAIQGTAAYMALFAFYNNPKSKDLVNNAVADIEGVGDIDIKPALVEADKLNHSLIKGLLDMFVNEMGASIWKFFISLANMMGLSLVSIGGKDYVFPFMPNTSTGKKIELGQQMEFSIENNRLFDVSRVIACSDVGVGFNPNTWTWGEYPRSTSPTAQEKEEGMFIKVVKIPFMFGRPPQTQKKDDTMSNIVGSAQFSAYMAAVGAIPGAGSTIQNLIKAQIKKAAADGDQVAEYTKLTQMYAEYIYSVEKNKDRAARFVLSFSPDIIPGFVYVCYDPLMPSNPLSGFVNKVSHSISADGQAVTIVDMNYCRKEKESINVDNPIYTGYNTSSAINQIIGDMKK